MALEFLMTYAGVPFVLDQAKVVRLEFAREEKSPADEAAATFPRKYQPLADLVDEVDRLVPFRYLQDFGAPSDYPGRNLGAVASLTPAAATPNPQVRVGDWYYPRGASRFSVFRGLATSTQVKAMLAAVGPSSPNLFVMRANPASPTNPNNLVSEYTLSTLMYMLPPRPLGETAGALDGLYLVTLVDDRCYFDSTPVNLTVTRDTTWLSLIATLTSALGIVLGSTPDIAPAYGRPEPDSQLWTRAGSAAVLLDAVAANVGRVVVRNLDGTYDLLNPLDSYTRYAANLARLYPGRVAGGDIFQGPGTLLPAGDLRSSRNRVVPQRVYVTFPRYVEGDDPVPHFLNQRYPNQRPSCWYEESYGHVYALSVPILSGGFVVTSGALTPGAPLASGSVFSFVSGLAGAGEHFVNDTAKALYSGEASATTLDPVNISGLTALAMRVASDYYNGQVAAALDEVFPGTFTWDPEGFHDVVWTYSARSRLATTRVLRTEWDQAVREMQHATPPVTGYTNTPRGVGGPSVPQTWRDQVSGDITAKLAQTMLSGATAAVLTNVNYLPTDNRWRGRIDNEVILFEGTSGGALDEGGAPISTAVDVVHRGVDGTLQVEHANLSDVRQVLPDVNYGTNLVTHGPMQWVFPKAWTSGGVQEAQVVPQTQTVQVLDSSGVDINGVIHRSGVLMHYRTDLNNSFVEAEPIWVIERNDGDLKDNVLYDGQFVGYSAQASGLSASGAAESGAISGNYLTFPSAPTYAVNNLIASSGQIFSSGSVYYIFYNNHYYYNTNIFYGSGTVVIYDYGYPVYNYFTENNFNGGVYDPGFWAKIRFVPPLNNTFLVEGFRGGRAGRMLIVWNAGEGGVRLLNDAADADSVCVPMSEATSYNIPPRDGVILEYDGESKCWRFDHPSFGTGPAAVGSPQCYATRYMRFASGISYTVANEVNGVVDIGPGLVVKNSAGTTTVGNVHTIIFDSQLADFLVTGDGDGTATISQAGLTVTKTVVTNVTCDDGVLQVYRETWVFRRGRLSLVV